VQRVGCCRCSMPPDSSGKRPRQSRQMWQNPSEQLHHPRKGRMPGKQTQLDAAWSRTFALAP